MTRATIRLELPVKQGSDTERAELEAFAEAIEGGAPYACPQDDAVHGVAILEAIVKSARSARREPIG
jgi:predicted dehydrogenase